MLAGYEAEIAVAAGIDATTFGTDAGDIADAILKADQRATTLSL